MPMPHEMPDKKKYKAKKIKAKCPRCHRHFRRRYCAIDGHTMEMVEAYVACDCGRKFKRTLKENGQTDFEEIP